MKLKVIIMQIIIGITTKSLSVLLFGCQSIEVYVDSFIYVLTILVVLILKSLFISFIMNFESFNYCIFYLDNRLLIIIGVNIIVTFNLIMSSICLL